MDIIKELEGLNFDESIYTEKTIKDCVHNEKVALDGTLSLVEKKTKNGAPYFLATITDKTGSINCAVWDNTPLYKLLSIADNGNHVKVYGIASIGKYKNIDIKQMQFVEYEEEEIVEEESATSIPNLKKALEIRVDKITNEYLKAIANEAINIVGDTLEVAPFTEKTAYNYKGGLLHEVIDACDMASAIVDSINCGFDNNSTILNEDILLVGCILANLGKTRTLTITNGIPTKTFDGMLEEDAIFSREIAYLATSRVMETIPIEEKDAYDNIFKEILHMVASVKGNKTFGALSVPRSKHALILSEINNIVYTKGLFENLEKEPSMDGFSKAYDNGKNYFLGNIEE